MQLGRVVGHATATVKHASLAGQRLLVLQLLTATGQPDGEPVLAIDHLGAAFGSNVLASTDGLEARKMTGSKNTPVRWWVLGVPDR